MSLVFRHASIESVRIRGIEISLMHRNHSIVLRPLLTALLLAAAVYCQAVDPSERLAQARSFVDAANSCDTKNTKCRITAYTKAIETAPTFAEAYNGRGLVYRAAGDLDHALADFNKVIEIDPRSAQGFYYRAIIFAAKNDLPSAIEDFSKAIELLPESWASYVGRGNAHLRSRHYQSAVADFEKAMQIEPKAADAWYGRGMIYYLRNE